MKTTITALLALTLMLSTACGGEEAPPADGDTSEASDAADAALADSPDAAGGETDIEDEMLCWANMEGIAMFMLTHTGGGAAPCAASLEELRDSHPAYAQLEVTCGSTALIYEVNEPDFTVTCPNGHGSITNDEPDWSW